MRKKSASSTAAQLSQSPDDAIESGTQVAGRVLLDGAIVRMRPNGEVLLRSSAHGEVVCRLPMGVNATWLKAALALGPVDAEGTYHAEAGRGSVWALFPNEEQARLLPAHVEVAASETLSLRCGKTTIALEKDGSLQVKGRDVTARGSRSTRISGGVVRIN